MNSNPKISVVLVCYNAAQSIEKTILSVVEQEYKNIEFVVVDGASKDGTLDIIKKYEKQLARFISEPDKGVYDAMNKALHFVTGDYIYFIGAGDTVATPTAFSRLIAQARGADVILGNVNVVDGNKLIYLREQSHLVSPGSELHDFVSHQGVIIKTEAVRQAGGFDPAYRICSDYDQFLKIIRVQKRSVEYVPVVIANYPTDGISSVSNPERVKKVNNEFAAVRNKYRSLTDKIKHNKVSAKVRFVWAKIQRILKAGINVLTSWIIIVWWLYLKLTLPKGTEKSVIISPEFSSHGGTRTYLLMLVNYYLEKNWKVAALLDKQQQEDAEMIATLDKLGVTVIQKRTAPKLLSKLALNNWVAQIIHGNYEILPALRQVKASLIVSSVATNGLNIHLFAIPRNLLFVLHTYGSARIGLWSKLLVRAQLSARKQFVTVSSFSLERTLQVWGLPKSEYTKVIYNYAPEPKLKSRKHSGINVLTIGLMEDFKAPDLWVQLTHFYFDKYPEDQVNFRWAGSGSLFDYAFSYTRDIQDKVHLLGLLNQDQVAEEYAIADIYLQPSRIESFGISTAEAMRYGIPGVVSGNTALSEIIGDQQNGFVIPEENVEAYAEAIHKLAHDVNLRLKFGKNAEQKAGKMFIESAWKNALDSLHSELTDK